MPILVTPALALSVFWLTVMSTNQLLVGHFIAIKAIGPGNRFYPNPGTCPYGFLAFDKCILGVFSRLFLIEKIKNFTLPTPKKMSADPPRDGGQSYQEISVLNRNIKI